MAKKRKTPWLTIIFTASITFIISIFLFTLFENKIFPPKEIRGPAFKELEVFFGNEEGKGLKAEKIKVKRGALEFELKEVLETLIRGPKTRLNRTIPEGTRLLSIKIRGSTAYADFSRELIKNHPGGSSGELQTVYSIVNTVTFNFPAVKDVQILVEGRVEDTIAGHIDISTPLGPAKKLVKELIIG